MHGPMNVKITYEFTSVLAIIHRMLNKRKSRQALEKRFRKWKVPKLRNSLLKLQHRQECNAVRTAFLLGYYAE